MKFHGIFYSFSLFFYSFFFDILLICIFLGSLEHNTVIVGFSIQIIFNDQDVST